LATGHNGAQRVCKDDTREDPGRLLRDQDLHVELVSVEMERAVRCANPVFVQAESLSV
jgi:hypothetical protein